MYFRAITHLGGATSTISSVLLFIFFSPPSIKYIGYSSALALLVSHLPVALIKRFLPRRRPYLTLTETKVPSNPLVDHSFPSGHTTAIFSVIIPILLLNPILSIVLLPVACSVGISRVYLGLHYPSDVFVGGVLGTMAGYAGFEFCKQFLAGFTIL
jgi:undecaprenyl-diphosphatase